MIYRSLLILVVLCSVLTAQSQDKTQTLASLLQYLDQDSLKKVYIATEISQGRIKPHEKRAAWITCSFVSARDEDADKIESFKDFKPAGAPKTYYLQYAYHSQTYDTYIKKKYNIVFNPISRHGLDDKQKEFQKKEIQRLEADFGKGFILRCSREHSKIVKSLGVIIDSTGKEKTVNLDRMPGLKLSVMPEFSSWSNYVVESRAEEEYSRKNDFKFETHIDTMQINQTAYDRSLTIRCIIDEEGRISPREPLEFSYREIERRKKELLGTQLSPDTGISFYLWCWQDACMEEANRKVLDPVLLREFHRILSYPYQPGIYKNQKVKTVVWITVALRV